MRLLADLHIAPRTVAFLKSLGHDVIRVTDLLPANASDEAIVKRAAQERRTILITGPRLFVDHCTLWSPLPLTPVTSPEFLEG